MFERANIQQFLAHPPEWKNENEPTIIYWPPFACSFFDWVRLTNEQHYEIMGGITFFQSY